MPPVPKIASCYSTLTSSSSPSPITRLNETHGMSSLEWKAVAVVRRTCITSFPLKSRESALTPRGCGAVCQGPAKLALTSDMVQRFPNFRLSMRRAVDVQCRASSQGAGEQSGLRLLRSQYHRNETKTWFMAPRQKAERFVAPANSPFP